MEKTRDLDDLPRSLYMRIGDTVIWSCVTHLGDRSSSDMNEEQELEQAAGESVTQLSLAAESDEEPILLLLSRSEERQL